MFYLFLSFFFRADAKPRINRRTVPIVNMTISFCENSIFGSRVDKGEKLRVAHSREAPLSCFSFLSFFSFLSIFRGTKSFSAFFLFVFLSFFQTHIVAGTSITVSHRCFLRSRCSMEMWCLDDTGRDGWDWVGPPSWERA